MNTYKLTNITNRLNKRHPNFSSTLNIDYVDQMERKNLLLKSDETIFFTATSLPLSLHRLRMKGFITVSEVSEQEVLKLQNKETSKKETKKSSPKKSTPKKTTKNKSGSTKTKSKRTYSKRTTTTTTTKKEDEDLE